MAHLHMVATVQPFLSGGVSKTVPLPIDVDTEAIETISTKAWRLELNSISAYREASRLAQPLFANQD